MKKTKLSFWGFLFPVLFAFVAVQLIPTVIGLGYSFTDWNGISREINFVNFDNYARVFTGDPEFMGAFWFTVRFAIVTVISVNLVGFALALIVTQGFKGSNLLRAVFFVPNLIGGILLGFTWQFIFTKVFQSIGDKLGLGFLDGWLSTPETGFWGLVIVTTWQLAGYMMIIYIASIQNIPDSLKEAAQIDGAGPWKRLTRITIPLIAPAFTIGLFLSLSNSFKLFDQNLSLTGGGPYKSTQMLALNIYNTAFTYNELGYAQAKAVIFLIVVAVISLTQLYFSKKREVEM
ncbi:sugar ABC transporter permease [Clostridiaceae bacterium NSJ-31]|uniref:Sugar ABC transporter permease n=1 Tax=Ligaoa zhengdingensis TaxID=2763658 RepID=A0A926I557_9FIRM|nr:sugar ABC transporter permease [Ligaoa zhengdingensis]MBC8546936.1 sugar ABC transporter permease [Ligaoa zhengdingensis]